MRAKVVDYDLADGAADLSGLEEYRSAFILLRWRGRPVGRVWLEVRDGVVAASDIWLSAGAEYGRLIAKRRVEELLGALPTAPLNPPPAVSVAICTRDRPDDLRRCLDALGRLSTQPEEIIVVDNASVDGRTFEVCHEFGVAYAREDRPGLNWARTRAALLAKSEVIAFIDDDAVADKRWLEALREPFLDPGVSAVTGLVMPLELETRPQERFEVLCGFSRGFERRDLDARSISPLGGGNAGAGASMAFRRELVNELGLFSVELDAGTEAQAGGDTYAFYRLLALGRRIVYTPDALVWHRHRRSALALRRVLQGYSLATYVYLLRCLILHREFSAIAVGVGWFRHHHLRRLGSLATRHRTQSARLTLLEMKAVFSSPLVFVRTFLRERRQRRGAQ